MNNKMKPALIGGVVLGILSAIPFIGALNACCCLWAIVGGLLATYLYVKGSATPATPGDGVVLGLIAGAIGAVIYVVLGLPLGLLTGNATLSLMSNLFSNISPEAGEAIRQSAAQMENMSMVQRLVASIPGALIGAVCLLIFSTIGGLLGVPLFEKRKGGAVGTPPPPQNYGGGGGAY
jgi:hypothetical protein